MCPIRTAVKKYKAYSKLKKALAANGAMASIQAPRSSEEVARPEDPSNNSKSSVGLHKPTKQVQRTNQTEAVIRTPTRNREVEYVSPRNVAIMSPRNTGFMSPQGAVHMSPSIRHKMSDKGYQSQAPIDSITIIQHSRSIPMSPSGRSGLKSPFASAVRHSPSTRFTIRKQARATTPNALSPVAQGATTPSQLLRTPTRIGISSQYLPNPHQSPSLSRTSPFFGGMNNRRTKLPQRPVTHLSDLEDLEPASELLLPRNNHSPTKSRYELTADTLVKNAILSTPQKSGAAKMARSLFKSPSFSYPVSPSSRHQTLDSLLGTQECSSRLYRRGRQGSEGENSNNDNPFDDSSTSKRVSNSSQTSVDEAMDSMTIDDNSRASSKSQSEERVIRGSDNDDDWDYGSDGEKSQDNGLSSPETEMLKLMRSGTAQELMCPSRLGYIFATSTPKTSPSWPRHGITTSPLRTPSQPSLTFSQPTPGSAKSDIDIMVVPPGFHSHFRRRQAPSAFFLASQEEDKKFEKEFLGLKAHKSTTSVSNDSVPRGSAQKQGPIHSTAAEGGDVRDTAGEGGWEETESETESETEQKDVLDTARKSVPKKKYTQKRSTRLHRSKYQSSCPRFFKWDELE